MASANSSKDEPRSSSSKASFYSQNKTTSFPSKASSQTLPSSENNTEISTTYPAGFLDHLVVDDHSPGRQGQLEGAAGLSLLGAIGKQEAGKVSAIGPSSDALVLQVGEGSNPVLDKGDTRSSSSEASAKLATIEKGYRSLAGSASIEAELAGLVSPTTKLPALFSPLREAEKSQKSSSRLMQQSGEERPTVKKSTRKKPETIDLTTPPPESQAQPQHASEQVQQAQPATELQESYLHRLPAELRNRIYRCVGLSCQRLNISTMDEPALTAAIPDLRDEMHSIVFSENKLRVRVFCKDGHVSPHRLMPMTMPSQIPLPRNNREYATVWLCDNSWVQHVDPRFVLIKHIDFRVFNCDGFELFDFFVNVRQAKDGKHVVAGRMDIMGTRVFKTQVGAMGELARAVTKRTGERDGFVGLSWEDAEEIAACFSSVDEAKKRFTKKRGKVMLI